MAKVLIFISGGIGDIVLLIPMIREMKNRGYDIDAVFFSCYPLIDIFLDNQLVSNAKTLANYSDIFKYVCSDIKKYDYAFLNRFALTKTNILISLLIAKNRVFLSSPTSKKQKILNLFGKNKKAENGKHDIVQNFKLLDLDISDNYIKDNNLLTLTYKPNDELIKTFCLEDNFFIIQLSSGSNTTTHKNWPIQYWINFIHMIRKNNYNMQIVLLGDNNEVDLSTQVTASNISNVVSLVGKTSLSQAIDILYLSKFYVGLDSGLNHLASFFSKPTFTIWGGSDYRLYGYAKFNEKSKIMHNKLECWPCDNWIERNQTKVKSPHECVSLDCLMGLAPLQVYTEFKKFITEHKL